MSYSLNVVIAESSQFRLYSYGNGDAYHLVEVAHDAEPGVFVQGDDATEFRAYFDAYCESQPTINHALAELWNQYTY